MRLEAVSGLHSRGTVPTATVHSPLQAASLLSLDFLCCLERAADSACCRLLACTLASAVCSRARSAAFPSPLPPPSQPPACLPACISAALPPLASFALHS